MFNTQKQTVGRPRTRLHSGTYIVQIIGYVEHLSYGRSQVAKTRANQWLKLYGIDEPQFHFRLIYKPITMVDLETGELVKPMITEPQVTTPFCIGDRGITPALIEKYGLSQDDNSLEHRFMAGLTITLPIEVNRNGISAHLLNGRLNAQQEPVANPIIKWTEGESEISLEEAIPYTNITQQIKRNVNLALQLQSQIQHELSKNDQ